MKDILGILGQMTGDKKYDKHGYHCVICEYELEQIVVKTALQNNKKIFFCKRNTCPKYGMLTVVARIKNK